MATNRIVGYDQVDPATLCPNPANWRRHPTDQRDWLNSLVEEVGYIGAVVVNRTNGYLLDGHMRVEEAVRRGDETIPVLYVELDEDEERRALAEFDPIGALFEADAAALEALVQHEREAVERLANGERGGSPARDGDGDGDGDDDEGPTRRYHDERYALAIVLNQADWRWWQGFKEQSGVASDGRAFGKLRELAGEA